MAGRGYSQTVLRCGAGTLVTGLLLTLSVSGAAQDTDPAPKKYRFRSAAAAGDVRTIDDRMEMQLELVMTVDGQELPLKFGTRSREAYTEEVLALKKDAALYRRSYTAHRQAETTPDGQSKVVVSSLQGKTVTIRVNGRKVTVTAEKGKLAAADVKELQEKFSDDDDTEFVPNRDLTPGDEWTLPADALAKAFKGLDKGEVKGRFERVFEEAGRSLAELQFTLTLEGSPGGSPLPLHLTGTGTTFYDLKLNRELGSRFGGPISTEGELEQAGKKVRMVGSGLLDTHQTVRWLKVAGKPVNAPAYPPPAAPAAPNLDRSARVNDL